MGTTSTAGYGEQAEALVIQYESITFEDVHHDVLHLLPAEPARIADIGAGTGRDAAALARRGHHVVAIEPTAELREAGRQLHADVPIEWLDDSLPALAKLREQSVRFDAIMLTAVWMHLDAEERAQAMAAVDALLADHGLVFLSLRHGPVPAGRRMFDVSAEETIALAAPFGMRAAHCSQRSGLMDRTDVHWTNLVLQR
ncbi:class I SAM-dependent methyltransferase [Cupriavidus sp. BIS7]|uniref:class I SAM-dependent methyltransferase n=1 Tax=Cupriavidus sp. BIS7 TaxID=1217718 RepID=UPI00030B6A94|nr:class I SAM-dependent methyltransferase [Cupriavidus sp. BIS7]